MSTNQVLPPSPPEVMAMQKAPTDPLAISHIFSADQVSQRVQLVQQVYRAVMKDKTHFGIVPGCQKPSLWKAGSEQLLMTFRLAVEPYVEDLSTPDCARYRVACRITHAPTGQYLGSGIGECSSDELKYKWRKAVSRAEYDDTPADRRRIKYGDYNTYQVRMEVADVANTVLKMAKKRAQIDATLTVTAASDIFTQDLEDMEHPVDSDATEYDQRTETPAPVAMPQRKTAAPQTQAPTQHAATQERTTPLQPRSYAEPQQSAPQPPKHTAPQGGPVISEPQAKRLFAIAMGAGVTKFEMKKHLVDQYGIEDDRQMPRSIYEEVCTWASNGGR